MDQKTHNTHKPQKFDRSAWDFDPRFADRGSYVVLVLMKSEHKTQKVKPLANINMIIMRGAMRPLMVLLVHLLK